MLHIIFLSLLPVVLSLPGVILYKKYAKWVVRKYIHTMEFVIAAIYGTYVDSIPDLIMVVGLVLLIVGVLSLIPSIQFLDRMTAIGTREGESQRSSIINMALTLAVAVILVIILQNYRWFFMASMLVVGFGDTLGEFIGRPFGKHKYSIFSEKSVEGSLGVFAGSFFALLLSYLLFNSFNPISLALLLLVALILAIVEAFSFSMLDNLLMPVTTTLLLFILF